MNDDFSLERINNSLERFFNQEDIIKETAQQIIKDFAEFSFEIEFSGNGKPYNELFYQLEPIINLLITQNSSQFYSLLYRIDISEKQLAKAIHENKNISEVSVITDLIIRRELKKVLTRWYFSGKLK